jgi:hypothetical protein
MKTIQFFALTDEIFGCVADWAREHDLSVEVIATRR